MISRFGKSRVNQRSRKTDFSSYSVQCDRSGFRANASDCVRQWDDKLVIREFAEAQHPQEFIRLPREDILVPDARIRDTSNEVDQTLAPDWDSY
jgi:hypothetical protein